MLYQELVDTLIKADVCSPRLEARLLIAHVCNLNPNDVTSHVSLTDVQKQHLEMLVQQRLEHKPLDKILGHKEFYKYDFLVTESVLSPRPDTEILLEAVIDIIRTYRLSSVLDLGTGSGCILLSLLKEITSLQGIGVDKSDQALNIAYQNAKILQVDTRCNLLQADWFYPSFTDKIKQRFDMIVSNPPYIPTADIDTLETEVKNFDPILALDGGYDGLDSYRKIAEISPLLLTTNGYVALEIGINQADDVNSIFTGNGFNLLKIIKDLSGIERCLIFVKK